MEKTQSDPTATEVAPYPVSLRKGWTVEPSDAAELARLTPRPWIFTAWAAFHVSIWLLAMAGVFLTHAWPLKALLGGVLASQLHTLTILQHDCGHGSAYRSLRANRWMGRLLAWPIVMPFTAFQEVHKRHHWYLGNPKKDPDEWFYAAGPRMLFVREMLFSSYFVRLALTQYGPLVRRRVIRELAVNLAVWGVVVYMLLEYGKTFDLFFALIFPLLGLAMVISPLARGYEHYPMSFLRRGDPARMSIRSNTVTIRNPALSFLWANITYHVEHHLFPQAAFFHLPTVHRILLKRNRFIIVPYPLHPAGRGLVETKTMEAAFPEIP
jgi:fatty acid desaturase